jgi:hypothetical protein
MSRAALLALATLCASSVATAGDAPREEHGSGDAYARPAVALAWGILRHPDESKTAVVVRIVADPATFARVAAIGRDPFSDRRTTMLAATAASTATELRVPRAHFADFPRTEIRFYSSATATADDAPNLVVYYVGVPDTTPELADEPSLARSLADRIERARTRAAPR